MLKKPKPLEIEHFGFDTDELSDLVVFQGFFLSIFVPVDYLCVPNYLGSQTVCVKRCI